MTGGMASQAAVPGDAAGGLCWRGVAGGLCWLLTLLTVAMQPIVAAAWDGAYDLDRHTISALGVTECGVLPQLGGVEVPICSPLHALMNATFVAGGLLIVAGTALTWPAWPRRRLTRAGQWALVATGLGSVLIGLAPANERLALHAVGALLQLPGSVAPLLLVPALWSRRRRWAVFSAVVGLVGTFATVLYFAGAYLGLGVGVMEHLAFDPLIVWFAVVGLLLLRGWSPKTRPSPRRSTSPP